MRHAFFAQALSALLMCLSLVSTPTPAETTIYDRLLSAQTETAAEKLLASTFGKDTQAAQIFFRQLTFDQYYELYTQSRGSLRALFKILPLGVALPRVLEGDAPHADRIEVAQLAAAVELNRLDDRWMAQPEGVSPLQWAIGSAMATGGATAALLASIHNAKAALPIVLSGGLMSVSMGFSVHLNAQKRAKVRRSERQSEWIEVAIRTMRQLREHRIPLDRHIVNASSQFLENATRGVYPHRLFDSLIMKVPEWQQIDVQMMEGSLVNLFQHYSQLLRNDEMNDEELEKYTRSWLDHLLMELSSTNRLIEKNSEVVRPFVARLSNILRQSTPPGEVAHTTTYYETTDSEGNFTKAPPTTRFVEVGVSPVVSKEGKLSVYAVHEERGEKRWHFYLTTALHAELKNRRNEDVFLPNLETKLGAGYWFKYEEVGEKFFFVPADSLPETIAAGSVGAIEIWQRPWSDRHASARFDGKKLVDAKMIRAALKLPPSVSECPIDLALAAGIPVQAEAF